MTWFAQKTNDLEEWKSELRYINPSNEWTIVVIPLQRNRINTIHLRGGFLKAQAHTVKETEKSHDLCLQGRDPESNSVRVLSPENFGNLWCKFWSESEILKVRVNNVLRAGKIKVSIQIKRENLPYIHLFVLFRPSVDWMRPSPITEDTLFYSKSTYLNVNLIQKHCQRQIQNDVWLHIWTPWPSQLDT